MVVACLEPGKGPRRYVVPGHHLDGTLMFGTLQKVTGRRHPHVTMPPKVALVSTRMVDQLNRMLPGKVHVPGDAEAAALAVRDTRFDTSRTTEELGVTARPFEETMRDTLLWLVEAGHLKPKYAGKLVDSPS